MGRRILIALIVLCSWQGWAHAQDQDSNRPEIFVQLGHSGQVLTVAFSSDGSLLASGSDDKTIKLWNVASGRELRTLAGHSNAVESVAFSPDGKLLASGSDDKTIKLWDVASGRELRTLAGHGDFVKSIAFSPDGKRLASGSGDKTIKLWDVDTGRELQTFNGHTAAVFSVAFSPDGAMLASGGDDKTIKLWDVANGRELRTLDGHSNAVMSVAFSPDGKSLASGSGDLSIKLWDVTSGRELRTLPDNSFVYSVRFSPDGKFLASGDRDGALKLWDVAGGSGPRIMSGESSSVYAVAFSPDGKMIVSGTSEWIIQLWDAATTQELRIFRGHSQVVTTVAFSHERGTLAAGNWGKDINLWDAKGLRELRGHRWRVSDAAFSPDGKLLASASWDRTVRLWDAAGGRELRSLIGQYPVESVAFSPDGKRLVSGSSFDTITLWDVATGRKLWTLAGVKANSVAFSPDGILLASGSGDLEGTGRIELRDAASGRELRVLSEHSRAIKSVAFSPDGKLLASGSGWLDSSGEVKLWDVASGRELRTLDGHDDVLSVAFSPDGKVLASGGFGGDTKLWDVATGLELHGLGEHSVGVNSVAFSPDGEVLASGGEDGTVREWNVADGRERAAFIAFTDGSSLAITPEGYFDSSSAQAENNLNVRVGAGVLGISSYRDQFYRPDLVKLSVAGTSLAKFGNLAEVAPKKLPPKVELLDLPSMTTNSALILNVRVTDGGDGIGLVRVFRNGTAFKQDADLPKLGGAITRSYKVPLYNGHNEIRVVAFNADASVQSNDATASITANIAPAPKGTLHALVIGIQDFPNAPKNNLTYPNADAALFADTLKKFSAPLFENLDIKVLTGVAETDRAHVIQALKDMKAAVGPDDEFVFYVASHGFIASDGDYYLITSNVGQSDPAHLKIDAIGRQTLTGLLADIPAAKKLVVIDTCYAEPLGDTLLQANLTKGMSTPTAATILSREIGLTVLSATTTDEEANEGYKDHGLFTYVVADGLTGKASAQNGTVSDLGIANYVNDNVPQLALAFFRKAQNPTVNTHGQGFPITKVK
jgi:WD40 repeat protein